MSYAEGHWMSLILMAVVLPRMQHQALRIASHLRR